MGYTDAHNPAVLREYEGLVCATARRLAPHVDYEVEDIEQILWVKVYKALLAYDEVRWANGTRSSTTANLSRTRRDKYVNMCVRDQVKDVVRKRRLEESFIEDLAPSTDAEGRRPRESFDLQYLCSTREENYGAVEEGRPLVPNTLTQLELRIVVLLYRDYKQSEVARKLGMDKREMERHMRSIRAKMEDWRPSVLADHDLPVAA